MSYPLPSLFLCQSRSTHKLFPLFPPSFRNLQFKRCCNGNLSLRKEVLGRVMASHTIVKGAAYMQSHKFTKFIKYCARRIKSNKCLPSCLKCCSIYIVPQPQNNSACNIRLQYTKHQKPSAAALIFL